MTFNSKTGMCIRTGVDAEGNFQFQAVDFSVLDSLLLFRVHLASKHLLASMIVPTVPIFKINDGYAPVEMMFFNSDYEHHSLMHQQGFHIRAKNLRQAFAYYQTVILEKLNILVVAPRPLSAYHGPITAYPPGH